MWPLIVNSLPGFVVGAILTWLGIRWTRKTKIIQYRWDTSPIVLTKSSAQMPDGVSLTAKKALFEPDAEDGDSIVHIENARATAVRIKNVGNDVVENMTFSIELDEDSTIIEHGVSPDRNEELCPSVEVDSDIRNRAIAKVPYLNKGHTMIISVVSASTGGDFAFDAQVYGKGIEVRVAPKDWSVYLGLFLSLILIFALMALPQGVESSIPEEVLVLLGGKVVSEPELQFPLVVQLLMLAVAASPGAYAMYRDSSYWRF